MDPEGYDQALGFDQCHHEWVDPSNEVVDGNGSKLCLKCFALADLAGRISMYLMAPPTPMVRRCNVKTSAI